MQSKENFLLISGEETPIKDMFDWNEYRVAYFLNKNIEKSTLNEDCLFITKTDNFICFGVSDGAGGHPRGKDAATTAAQSVIDYFKKNKPSARNMLQLLENVNESVLALKAGARTTLAMSTIEGDTLRSFSVGDSEILYSNSLGHEIYSNIPHSRVGYKVESGVIDQEASLDDPERNLVNNMLGDESIRVEMASKVTIKKGHTILVGTDGLFDNIPHETLFEMAGTGVFEKSFESLCEICTKRDDENWKKDDDIAFIILRKIKSQDSLTQ